MKSTINNEQPAQIIANYYAKNPQALADRKARAEKMARAQEANAEARKLARREAGCLSGI
jgi:hypothetical protein